MDYFVSHIIHFLFIEDFKDVIVFKLVKERQSVIRSMAARAIETRSKHDPELVAVECKELRSYLHRYQQ